MRAPPGRSRHVGGQRRLVREHIAPDAVVVDPLVGTEHPHVDRVDVRVGQLSELARAQSAAAGGQVGDQASPCRRSTVVGPTRGPRIAGRTSSALRFPLRSRSITSDAASRRRRGFVVVLEVELRAPELPRACRDDSWRNLAGAAARRRRARRTDRERGATGRRRGGRVVDGSGSRRSTSTYSAIDSAPVGSARPKLIFGRGVNPSLDATGRPARRSARSHMRATSRWLVNRTLPSFGGRTRSFTTPASLVSGVAPAPRPGRQQRDRDLAAAARVLAGALAAARGRDRRGDDVLDAVAGADAAVVARRPAAVLEPEPASASCQSPHRKSLCRPAVRWSHGRISCSSRCRDTYQSSDRPSAAIASCQRSRSEVLAPLLEHAARRASTRSMTRPMRRSPRVAMPSATLARRVVPLELHAALGLAARLVADAGRPCAAARSRCSGRTTGTGCAAWARTRRG